MDELALRSRINLYFEDVGVGDTFRVTGRALTEVDLLDFARISGDHHPIHTDAAYARSTRFGQRIAHGPLGIALAIGMFAELEQFHRATIAMTDIREWTFRAPVFIGDVLSLEVSIAGKRRTREEAGLVDRRLLLRKQDGTVAQEGLSADYVRRETRRAVAGAPPGLKIWPGIEIDIPTGADEKKTQPDDVYQAVKANFEGGADGIILSRKYSEMRLDNLRAAGRAMRELKLA